MDSVTSSAHCRQMGLIAATIGWILSMTSMGLVDWRVWHLNSTSDSDTILASVGMWQICVHHLTSDFGKPTSCYFYSYYDTFIPVSIRVGQHLLLAAGILGFLGDVSVIFALRKMFMRVLPSQGICSVFVISGLLNMVASTCVIIAIMWNYHSMMNEEGISFPPSFQIPFKPGMQEHGIAVLVAWFAAFMLMFGGVFHLADKCPLDFHGHPEDIEL